MRRLLLLGLAGTVLLVWPALAREWLAIGSGRTKGVGYGTSRTDMAFSVSCVAGSGSGRIANIDVGQLTGSRIPIRLIGPGGVYDALGRSEKNPMLNTNVAQAQVPQIAALVAVLRGNGDLTYTIGGRTQPGRLPLDASSTALFDSLGRDCAPGKQAEPNERQRRN